MGLGGFVVRGSRICFCGSADMGNDETLDRLDVRSGPEGSVDKVGVYCEFRRPAKMGRPPELYSLVTSSSSYSVVVVVAERSGLSSDETGISPDSIGALDWLGIGAN
jgi:hypothetical protein